MSPLRHESHEPTGEDENTGRPGNPSPLCGAVEAVEGEKMKRKRTLQQEIEEAVHWALVPWPRQHIEALEAIRRVFAKRRRRK